MLWCNSEVRFDAGHGGRCWLLTALAQKVTGDTADPIVAGVNKAFRTVA
jgi:hypothetical protein